MTCHTFRFGVSAAIAIALGLGLQFGAAAQTVTPTASTPRTSDGKPDLSGMWGGGGGERGARNFDETGTISSATASRRCGPGQRKCDEHTNQSYDQEFVREDTYNGEVRFSGRWDANRPVYKPEYWDRIQYLDKNTNTEDPILKCQPQGITREGPPTKIVQTAKEIIFFYGGDDFRIVPIDGRPHDPVRARDITFWGDAVGRWDGETLVVDSVGFNEKFWLAPGGLPHTEALHLVERFTRTDLNTLKYEVTVDDPRTYTRTWTGGWTIPWVPDQEIQEYFCEDNAESTFAR